MRTNLLLMASLCVLGCRSTTTENVVAEERTEPVTAETSAAQDTAADQAADREDSANDAIRYYADEAAERGQESIDAESRARTADARARESDAYARDMEAYARWLEREGVTAAPNATSASQPMTDEQALELRRQQLAAAQADADAQVYAAQQAQVIAAQQAAAAAAVPAPMVYVPPDATRAGQPSTRTGSAPSTGGAVSTPSTRNGDAAVTAGGTPTPITGGVPQPQPAGVPAPNAGAQVGGIPGTGNAPSVPGPASGVRGRSAVPGAAPVQAGRRSLRGEPSLSRCDSNQDADTRPPRQRSNAVGAVRVRGGVAAVCGGCASYLSCWDRRSSGSRPRTRSRRPGGRWSPRGSGCGWAPTSRP